LSAKYNSDRKHELKSFVNKPCPVGDNYGGAFFLLDNPEIGTTAYEDSKVEMYERGFPKFKELKEFAERAARKMLENFEDANKGKVVDTPHCCVTRGGSLKKETVWVEAMVRGFTSRSYAVGRTSDGDCWPEGVYVEADCFELEIDFNKLSPETRAAYLRVRAESKKLNRKLNLMKPYKDAYKLASEKVAKASEKKKEIAEKLARLDEERNAVKREAIFALEEKNRLDIAEAKANLACHKRAKKLGLNVSKDSDGWAYGEVSLAA
jgi:hypothetical protein